MPIRAHVAMLMSPNIKLLNEVSRSTSIQRANQTKQENAPRSHLPQSLQLQSGHMWSET